jgi:hypothetical protein
MGISDTERFRHASVCIPGGGSGGPVCGKSVPCYGDAWKRENENQKEKPQGKEDKELRKILCRTQSAA